jgi:hypothetical protein
MCIAHLRIGRNAITAEGRRVAEEHVREHIVAQGRRGATQGRRRFRAGLSPARRLRAEASARIARIGP